MKRFVWRCLYPVVKSAYAIGFLSYKWVNVANSAWLTSKTGFDALWHHRWFGDPIESLPEKVNLCGLRYKTSVSEGLVQFVANDGMTNTRIKFIRDPHDRYAFLWYIELSPNCPYCHVQAAYAWVEAVFGGDYVLFHLPLRKRPNPIPPPPPPKKF